MRDESARAFAWIFDLDGTLFESHHQIIESANLVRAALGYYSREPAQLFSRIGPHASGLFDDLDLGPEATDELVALFRDDLRVRLKGGTPLFDGVMELMIDLKSKGSRIGIATNKPDHLAELMIEISPIAPLVDCVQGSTGISPKPSPQVVLKVMEKLGADIGVMVGDRIEDIVAARAAGILAIGVSQTSHTLQELEGAGALYVFSNIRELGFQFKSNLLNLHPIG